MSLWVACTWMGTESGSRGFVPAGQGEHTSDTDTEGARVVGTDVSHEIGRVLELVARGCPVLLASRRICGPRGQPSRSDVSKGGLPPRRASKLTTPRSFAFCARERLRISYSVRRPATRPLAPLAKPVGLPLPLRAHLECAIQDVLEHVGAGEVKAGVDPERLGSSREIEAGLVRAPARTPGDMDPRRRERRHALDAVNQVGRANVRLGREHLQRPRCELSALGRVHGGQLRTSNV